MTDISREAALEAALKDTLDFFERHSNRYDEVNGKHPQVIVEEARAAIAMPVDAAEGRVTVQPLTFDEIVTIVETTEVSEMTANGDRRWTRRIAELLQRKQFSTPLTAPSDKIAEAARVLLDAYHRLGWTGAVYCAFDDASVYPPDAEEALRALAGKGE